MDAVEARFLALQRQRFSELMSDKAQLHKFILELQQSVQRLYGTPAFEFFRQTGAWERLQEYASAEDQKKFMDEWNDIVRLILSRGSS